MHQLTGLPDNVAEVIRTAVICEFATVSAAGVPIDTPLLYFWSDGLRSLDVATGLAYPAKAERARRNPKVGLLLEGGAGQPIVSVAGVAAVRDADLQRNLERYLSEVAWDIPMGAPWSKARAAIWYWARIIVSVTPRHIRWWPSADDMDRPPQRWDAPAGWSFPQSDPAPAGQVSAAPKWREYPWREFAASFLDKGVPGHLTLCDDDGYPLPIRARWIELLEDGFRLDIPRGAPWRRRGKATLTFAGAATFVGEVTEQGPDLILTTERVLPILPTVENPNELWEPSEHTRTELMRRLVQEAQRRGQPVPTVLETLPPFTDGARARIAGADRFRETEAAVMESSGP